MSAMGPQLGVMMFVSMLVLMALRVPIAAAMFVPGVAGYWLLTDSMNTINFLKGSAVARLTVYELSVIPLFLLMGQFASQGGLSRDLFRAAAALIGHVRGGLAMASVLSAGAFGAVCGSSVATSATITQVAYPQMRGLGYGGRLSTAALASGGTLGILIPPSVPLVVYAILTEQNIAKLFAAAMVPGLLAMLGYVMVVGLYARARPDQAPLMDRLPWRERGQALWSIWPISLIFVIVFGGIYGGVFSPTEGAGVGAFLTLVAGLSKRELKMPGIRASLVSTAETTGMVFMIFLGADMMNATLALTEMPKHVAEWVAALPIPDLSIVGAVLLLYILLGCVMDELSMLLLTLPVIFPAVMGLDLWGLNYESKALWFGILLLMTVSFGLIAPPIGLNVYVVNSLAKDVPMSETYKGLVPFLAWDALRMLALLFFPIISLGLVRVFFS
ncbi:TRAP transporter large permease [Limnohabitans sp.]|jgi:C4-dicarboxylate transporter, DctM subunit|uniref:TRAP transporter large permease n=1 Tax=Limnohabitans sp. TaxID=1907725 RepID=UPI00311D5B50